MVSIPVDVLAMDCSANRGQRLIMQCLSQLSALVACRLLRDTAPTIVFRNFGGLRNGRRNSAGSGECFWHFGLKKMLLRPFHEHSLRKWRSSHAFRCRLQPIVRFLVQTAQPGEHAMRHRNVELLCLLRSNAPIYENDEQVRVSGRQWHATCARCELEHEKHRKLCSLVRRSMQLSTNDIYGSCKCSELST
jgi:hypothetical protein